MQIHQGPVTQERASCHIIPKHQTLIRNRKGRECGRYWYLMRQIPVSAAVDMKCVLVQNVFSYRK